MADTMNVYSPADALAAPPGQAQQPTGVGGWLANPNNQALLAGIAAKLDPYGVGGALGSAVQEHVMSTSQQRVAQGTQTRQGDWLSGLHNYMKGMSPDKNSLFTPPGMPGLTGMKMKPDGSYSLDVNGPGPQKESPENAITETPLSSGGKTQADTAASAIPQETAVPSASTVSGPVTPQAPTPTGLKPKPGVQFSDLIPF